MDPVTKRRRVTECIFGSVLMAIVSAISLGAGMPYLAVAFGYLGLIFIAYMMALLVLDRWHPYEKRRTFKKLPRR